MSANPHYAAMGLCILLVPIAQTLLKLGSKQEDAFIRSFLRPQLLAGLFLLWLVTVLSVFSFQVVPLKTSAAWTSLTYVLVTLSARFVLGEKVPLSRWAGCLLIVSGILIFQQG